MQLNNVFFVYASQGFVALTGFLFSWLVATYSSKEQAGEFLYFLTVGTTASNLISAPLGLWFTRIAKTKEGASEAVTVISLWGCISLILLIISIAFLFIKQNVIDCLFFAFISASIFGMSYLYEWNASEDYKLYSIGIACISIIRLFAIGIILPFAQDSHTLALSVVFSAALSTFLLSQFLSKLFSNGVKRTFLPSIKKEHLNKGRGLIYNMSFSSLIFTVFQLLDKTIMKYLWGDEKNAELILSMQWSYSLITQILQPVITLVYPQILKIDGKKKLPLKIYIFKVFPFIVGVSIFILFLEPIFLKFLPNDYDQASGLLWIGVISGAFFIMGQIIGINFSREGSEKKLLKSIIIPVFLCVPIMYFLILHQKITGAMYGSLIFSVSYFLTCIILASKRGHNQ